MFPGALLLKLGLSSKEDAEASALAWRAASNLRDLARKASYVVRLHVYMGGDLPAMDDNGLLDPYLKVKRERWDGGARR